MGVGQGRRRGWRPREIALNAVGSEADCRGSIAIAVPAGFMLSGVSHLIDSDRAHEIELGTTDIDVRPVLRQMQREHHVSFVFSSHDPQVQAAADDTVVIRDGRITAIERRTEVAEVSA